MWVPVPYDRTVLYCKTPQHFYSFLVTLPTPTSSERITVRIILAYQYRYCILKEVQYDVLVRIFFIDNASTPTSLDHEVSLWLSL